MIEAAMPIVGPGMSSDGCGYSPSLQFTGMMTTFEKTGSITKTAEEAAKDAITFAEEFFKQQTIIPFGYEVVKGRWTSGGKTLDELGYGERIERVIRAEDGMFRDESITQALTVSEDTGSGRSYVYLFSRDKDSKNKISALAIAHNGTTDELSALLKNLSGSSHDFSQPLFFGEGKEIRVDNFFQAAYSSFATEERRSQMNSYLTRLNRDVSNFPNLVVEHQKQVDELAKKIEEDLMSNPDIVTGLALVASGLNKIVDEWIPQGPEPVFYETRTAVVGYSSADTTPMPPKSPKAPTVMLKAKETESEKDKDVAVGLFVQTLVSIITEDNEEEIIDIRETNEKTIQPSNTESGIETVADTIEPMVPVIGIVLRQLIEIDLETSDLQTDDTGETMSPFIFLFTPFQNQDIDITEIPEFVTPSMAPSQIQGLTRESKINITLEDKDGFISEIQNVLGIVLVELDKEEKGDEISPEKGEEIITIAETLAEFFTSDKSLLNIQLLLEVYRHEDTPEIMKELVVLFLYHEFAKIHENQELKVKYPEVISIFSRIELIIQNPILKRRYEKLVEHLKDLFKIELTLDDGWRTLSIVELVEMTRVKQHIKKWTPSFPKQGVIYQYEL